jgi:hypothetical protein
MPDNTPLVINRAIKSALTQDERWHSVAHFMSPDHSGKKMSSFGGLSSAGAACEAVVLGDAIRLVRSEREISQEALADTAGIHRSHMARSNAANAT